MEPGKFNTSAAIEITSSNWFNPLMNYRIFMVPGILAILVTMIGGYLSALNIVKEKEIGTIEQINVTPIKKYHFILGKLIPFWILGLIVFSLGLVVSWLVYGIIPLGSITVVVWFCSCLPFSGFGIRLADFNILRYPAAGDVYSLFLFNDFYFDGWLVHSH